MVCGINTDEHYKATRCPPDLWEQMYGRFGLTRVWGGDVLPCRVYLRHCYLAAKAWGGEVLDSFLDETVLVDRQTTIR